MNNLPCVLDVGVQNFSDLEQGEHFQIRVAWTGVGKMRPFQ